MKLLLIGCLTFFHLVGFAAVHPIKDVSIISLSEAPYLEAAVLIKDSCTKLDGSALLIDSDENKIILMQQVKVAPQTICSQVVSPKITLFALDDLAGGDYTLMDGFDENPLGVLRVSANGDVSWLER